MLSLKIKDSNNLFKRKNKTKTQTTKNPSTWIPVSITSMLVHLD